MDAPGQLPILAVLGAGSATSEELEVAGRVGAVAARCGWVVLTGGGGGVMTAASRGAVEAGGLTVAVLPVASPEGDCYPNPWVRVPIYTGAGMARNAFNVLSATLCVAVGGGTGTLSEIALALKAGIPIWCWRSWVLQPPGDRTVERRTFDDADELLSALELELGRFAAR
jgi:uncharacterized protein (TIGR00725 family)